MGDNIPIRRIEAGVTAFRLLAVGIGGLGPVGAAVYVGAALAATLGGDVLRRLRRRVRETATGTRR